MIFRYKIKFISDIEQKIRKLLVNIAVTPFVGVWIEMFVFVTPCTVPDWSLPSWECGLKSTKDEYEEKIMLSLPSWECGLKSTYTGSAEWAIGVTPFVGVWIEIMSMQTT